MAHCVSHRRIWSYGFNFSFHFFWVWVIWVFAFVILGRQMQFSPLPPTPRVGCELPDVNNNVNSSVSPVLCGQLPRASMEWRLHSWGLIWPGANWDRKPPLPCWSAGLLGDRQTLIPSSVVSKVSPALGLWLSLSAQCFTSLLFGFRSHFTIVCIPVGEHFDELQQNHVDWK